MEVYYDWFATQSLLGPDLSLDENREETSIRPSTHLEEFETNDKSSGLYTFYEESSGSVTPERSVAPSQLADIDQAKEK